MLNDGRGVVIEVEGDPYAVDAFAAALVREAPSLARVDSLRAIRMTVRGERQFVIAASAGGARTALIPPDVATCDECLAELFDPADRRYRYPLINCTQCGPRFTIVRQIPYDRPNTTMSGFEMCVECRAEY